MSAAAWEKTIKTAALRELSVTAVFPKGLPVLLIRRTGMEIYALANKCAHMGCPLARGSLDGYLLRCPCHDWTFDIRTGELAAAPEIKLPVYEWRIDGEHIHIRIQP